ncbi:MULTISPECIES: hypothetical protein [Candidatus Accumulibacter]|mgnify:CR=1 FL=1|uniref:hypothetical protein n=1 Tax=Candidatus Accumulibacter TaxID=327159 RepID=UPI001B7EAF24|nr:MULTISPECIES: hypothetical protein [Candidatus Accumulibacter]
MLDHRTLGYSDFRGERLDVPGLIAAAPADALFYVCGPARLLDAARDAAATHGVAADWLRCERFHAPAHAPD